MRPWLIGTDLPVTVVSDHKNLMYFMQSRSLNHQQTCWALFLQDFNFKLDWLLGSSNPVDFPSRCPDFQPKGEDTVDAQPILTNSHLERLYPHYSKPSSLTSPIEISSTITLAPTYSIDNSELLTRFKSAYLDDNEWHKGLAIQKLPGQPIHWRVEDNLVFHQDRLFVPKSL